MCFEIVQKYQTGDGKLHASEKAARQHVECVVCDKIASLLDDLVKSGHFARFDVISIVETLYENREALKEALALTEYGNDD